MIVGKKIRHILVADIGGTNARFAVADVKSDGGGDVGASTTIHDFRAYPCADFHDPIQLIQQYLSDTRTRAVDAACFAVAGPVSKGHAYLTNLGWDIDAEEVSKSTSIAKVVIANDFQALARSVTALKPEGRVCLHAAEQAATSGPISVMGPGTGFGLAQVLLHGTDVTVVPTEGGHASFVPHGNLETAVWNEVHDSMGRVTVETLMSGIGILRIYRAICSLRNETPRNFEPSTISQLALEHEDEACVDTLKVFCSMLGGVAADVALTQGATGGVFLGGGILPKIASFVEKSGLVASFLDKPPMEGYVAKISVELITDPEAALIGASLLATDHH